MARNTNKNIPFYYERVLSSVVDFLLLSGLPISEIRSLADTVLVKAALKSVSGEWSSANSGMETIPAVVLHRWHRDRDLLDSEANPIPLRLYGEAPSVEALVRDEEPHGSVRRIVDDMKSLGLVRKGSKHKYLPKSRVATIATLHPVLIEHVAHSLVRLLETVERNTSATTKKQGLIERFTHIPDLPIKEIPAFTTFSQEHGSAFLASVDDWLESRRAAAKSVGSCSAGIHVFAYVEQQRR